MSEQATDLHVSRETPTPPWLGDVAEITRSQLEQIRLRGSREDFKRLVNGLIEFDTLLIVDDPAPEEQ